jgi:hypothetical protein
MPTVGHEPAGMVRPSGASPPYTSISRAPAPIVAIPSCTRTRFIRDTSTTTPLLVVE